MPPIDTLLSTEQYKQPAHSETSISEPEDATEAATKHHHSIRFIHELTGMAQYTGDLERACEGYKLPPCSPLDSIFPAQLRARP